MSVYVNEYVRQGHDSQGYPIQCGEEPSIASYVLATGQTAVLNTKTNFVQLATDATPMCLKFSAAGTAAATTADRLPANTINFRAVGPGNGPLTLAVIATT